MRLSLRLRRSWPFDDVDWNARVSDRIVGGSNLGMKIVILGTPKTTTRDLAGYFEWIANPLARMRFTSLLFIQRRNRRLRGHTRL
jgi:hypothetical protein